MNYGDPTDDEKKQVELNHSTSGDKNAIGVGTDNIGVEKNLTPASPPTPAQPVTPSSPTAPTQTPAPEEPTITVTPAQVQVPPPTASSNPVPSTPLQNPQTPKPAPPSPPAPVGTPSPPPLTAPAPPQPQETEPSKIEVEATDIPIKSYDSSKTTDSATAVPPVAPPVAPKSTSNLNPTPSAPQPPIKANSGGPAATIALLAIMALILGSAGGFFGFRYFDNLKTSASTPESNLSTPADNSSPSTDTALWQTYTNDQYQFSLKYPNSWLKNSDSSDIVFAQNNAALADSSSGYRVEIVFQDSNGKTLKTWVEANATTTNEKKPINEVTVSGKTAYQQELSNNGQKVATYIEVPDQIMIITLEAPTGEIGNAGEWYNKIINSITL